MTRTTIFCLFAFSFASCLSAQGPVFTPIDYPGASQTQAWGIDTRGDIVGMYVNAGTTHGFLLVGGQYSEIDYPGASGTELYGSNPAGDIVGVYTLAGVRRGFLLSAGQYTNIDFPGAVSTETSAINARGDIVGFYVNTDKVTHGYLYSAGQYSTVDFPGSSLTLLTGINPQGDISLAYSDGVSHAALLSGGDFTSWDIPGATFTNTTGTNARGDIVGRYLAAGVSHGYLLSAGRFSTIDYPGSAYTGATAIDQRGDIVGRYRNADGVFHGFLLVGFQAPCVAPPPPPQIAMPGGAPAITHSSDFTLVSASKPAGAGEVLSLFATGLGATLPVAASGQPFPLAPLAPVNSLVEVRVNGRSAIVLAAVGLPGAVDGYQVNFRLPASTSKGSAVIQLIVANVAGVPVNIAVQ